MPNLPIAELITANLGNLPHPDGTPRQMAGYRTQTLPPGMAEVVTRSAEDVGLALVHLIETEGDSTIVANRDLIALRNQATELGAHDPIKVICHACGGFLMTLTLTDPTLARTNGSALKQYFRSEVTSTEGCSCS